MKFSGVITGMHLNGTVAWCLHLCLQCIIMTERIFEVLFVTKRVVRNSRGTACARSLTCLMI
jgi:hypothetical protein